MCPAAIQPSIYLAKDGDTLIVLFGGGNLTDKRYVGSVIVNQALSQFYESAPGRNWTLGLRWSVPL